MPHHERRAAAAHRRIPSAPQRVIAAGLALFLVSCGATRSSAVGPAGPKDLAKYALVFESQPDGQVAHAWIPLKELDLTKFQLTLRMPHPDPSIVRVSSLGLSEYCDGRYDQCVKDCLASGRPFVIGHRKYMDIRAQPWRIARGWWCPSNCMDAVVECKKGRGEWAEQYTAEFDAIDPAIDWIKKHRTKLIVGAVVMIAGVAFAVVVAGTGGAALVLAPLLLMAESSPESPISVQPMEDCR